jgi:hypothetical protein
MLLALVAVTPSARTIPAQPDAGQEPTGAPIFYNVTPSEGAIVSQDELSRATATIEIRCQAAHRGRGSSSTVEDGLLS